MATYGIHRVRVLYRVMVWVRFWVKVRNMVMA